MKDPKQPATNPYNDTPRLMQEAKDEKAQERNEQAAKFIEAVTMLLTGGNK